MSIVKFNNADRNINAIKNRTAIKKFINDIANWEGKSIDFLNYVFCSDDYLHFINVEHLNHDTFTDIITFDLGSEGAITGEIYISVDRVKENAKTYKASFFNELLRVIIHGLLHLCGYKDKTKSEITLMRQKENFYLGKFAETHS